MQFLLVTYVTTNTSNIAALALLDCSAVFDTVDHDILLRKLSESFGVGDTALQWLTFYLRGRLKVRSKWWASVGI